MVVPALVVVVVVVVVVVLVVVVVVLVVVVSRRELLLLLKRLDAVCGPPARLAAGSPPRSSGLPGRTCRRPRSQSPQAARLLALQVLGNAG